MQVYIFMAVNGIKVKSLIVKVFIFYNYTKTLIIDFIILFMLIEIDFILT